jgi:hypothetical protein
MTAAEYEELRSGIESEHNGNRDAREKQYVNEKGNLEKAYHEDLTAIRVAKEQAMVAAGLNPDGSDPQGRPQGGTPTEEEEDPGIT